jgi:hypothetical protein
MGALVTPDAVFARFPDGRVLVQTRDSIQAYYSRMLQSLPAGFHITVQPRVVEGQMVIDQEHFTGMPGERRAILLTRALDGWRDLEHWLQGWNSTPAATRQAILRACGELAQQLHAAGQMHGCFYPKHIFLKADGAGFAAQLIDLEKTRPLLFGRRDRIKDLEPLLRRASVWNEAEVRALLLAYLGAAGELEGWWQQLGARRRHKEAR